MKFPTLFRHRLIYFFLFSIIVSVQGVFAQTILINEFMASNGGLLPDPNGDPDDWVELYNPGTTSVNIGGYWVTDNLALTTPYQIPTTEPVTTTIPAGGYLVLWFDAEISEGVTHVKPKLSADGEAIVLLRPDGTTIVDSRVFGVQISNVSEGRKPNGGSAWDFYAIPTMGSANTTTPGAPKVAPVVFSQVGGKFTSAISVTLTCATPNAVIYYTVDGSEPTINSTLYTGPIAISNTKVLRARAILSPLLPSNIGSNSYFFNLNHVFPVVSLIFDPPAFFDPATGIYTNYDSSYTTKTHVEFFEPGVNTAAFSQDVEVELQGTSSVALPQKSLDLKPKASLGASEINYKIFPTRPYTAYKRLVLHNSGQDWNYTMFRDAFVAKLPEDLSDIAIGLRKPELHMQDFRPGVVYFNGQYWGIHNLRERMNKYYVIQHFNLADGTFDMIENESEVLVGTLDEWNNFLTFLNSNSFVTDQKFNELKDKIDYQNFLDYVIHDVIIDNEDWPGNNIRRFREKTATGKWKWICYDHDFSMGMFQQGGGWNTGDATPDALGRLIDFPNNFNWPNPTWGTLLFRKLWENATFRQDFSNRTADLLNSVYAPNRISTRLDQFKLMYTPEINQHYQRWWGGDYFSLWSQNIEKMRSFGNNRPAVMRTQIDDHITEVTGNANFTLNASPAAGGKVVISTITLSQANFPWTGAYFKGIKIPVKAIPNPGYIFLGWSDPSFGSSDSISVTLSAAQSLTANFGPSSPNCSITSVASSIQCNDNGTPSLSSDDKFNFQLAVTGTGIGTGWNTVINGQTINGTYGVAKNLGPYAISGGNLVFTVRDNTLATCTSQKTVSPPATCSNVPVCSINAAVSNITCNDAGTSSNSADDRFSFSLTVNGSGIGTSGWKAVIGGTTVTGSYGIPKVVGPFNIANGNLNFNVADANSTSCTTPVSVTAPAPCSNQPLCSINAAVSNITCNDAGTSSVATDDVFSFTLTVTGTGTTGWRAVLGGAIFTGSYGTPKTIGPLYISSGNLNFTVTDATNTTCSAPVTVIAPAPCSGQSPCTLNASVSNIVCNNAGTSGNSADDTYSFTILATGTNNGNGWNTIINGTAFYGNFGVGKVVGPFPIASGDVSFTVKDNGTPTCNATLTATAPAPCSGQQQCSINAAVSNIACNDAGTPSVATDDVFSFTLMVTGTGTGTTGWRAVLGGAIFTGSYGTPKTIGPLYISNGNLNFSVTDATNTTCSTPVTVIAPAPCSGQSPCTLNASVSNIVCNNVGTSGNSSDDTYSFTILATGTNNGNGWNTIINGTAFYGNFGVGKVVGPFPIASGDVSFTVKDNGTPTCNATLTATAPAPCSGQQQCAINAAVSNIACNDAGTPSIATDDVFSFTLTVTGTGTGTTGWRAVLGGAIFTGTYGTPKTIGPLYISNGNLNFNVTDATNTTCSTPVTVIAPAPCSVQPACSLNASITNITCNDAGTTSITTDDLFSFTITVTGTGTGSTGWRAVLGGAIFTGTYGTPKTIGPLNISSGNLNFNVTDATYTTCSTPVTVVAPAPCSIGGSIPYCATFSFYPWHDWIAGVKIGSFNKVSLKNTYTDNTNLTVNIEQDEPTSITLTTGFSFDTYSEYWRIWIDYNRDGTFNQSNEMVYEGILTAPAAGTTSAALNGVINIPLNVQLGTTRMRVSMKRGAYPTPCETFSFGEVEDYTVNITPAQNLVINPNQDPNSTSNQNNPSLIGGNFDQFDPNVLSTEGITIFPNPAGEKATVVSQTMINKPVKIDLYNVLGVKIKSWERAASPEGFFELDLSQVENDHYLLKIQVENDRPTSKVLVVTRMY